MTWTWILFLALNNTYFLRVSGNSLRNNATPTILSSSPPWYAISQTLFKLVARGNNEVKDKIWIFPLTSRTFYLNQSFPFYIFHTCHFGSKIIIYFVIRLSLFKVNNKDTRTKTFFLAFWYCWNWAGKCWLAYFTFNEYRCFLKVSPSFWDAVWLRRLNQVKRTCLN